LREVELDAVALRERIVVRAFVAPNRETEPAVMLDCQLNVSDGNTGDKRLKPIGEP
jgi:hypothetical protein